MQVKIAEALESHVKQSEMRDANVRTNLFPKIYNGNPLL